ncbi:MAG: hypothetical protein U0R44_00975 [Candidatus Micrarchaeia archaeon]
MIATINSFVSKVVGTVSGPLTGWGPKAPKKAKRPPVKTKKAKCSHKSRCKCS